MKYAVRYYSKTGSTKKVAFAIAEELGVEAIDVSQPLSEDVDILFLGGAPYAANLGKELRDFIAGINVKVGKVAAFSTSALLSNNRMLPKFKKACAKKEIDVIDDEFNCSGKFLHLHAKNPNEEDLNNAKAWTKKIIA